MLKLSEILNSKVGVDLEFVDLIQDEAQRDGSPIIKLVLKNPLPVVYGRRITDSVSGDSVTLSVPDVEIVNIGAEALKFIDEMEVAELAKPEADRKPLFTWTEEGKSGHLVCNLKLDVSQNQEVWIVKTSLAQFGRNQRAERQQRRNSNLVSKIREGVTKKELGNVTVEPDNKPQVVAN